MPLVGDITGRTFRLRASHEHPRVFGSCKRINEPCLNPGRYAAFHIMSSSYRSGNSAVDLSGLKCDLVLSSGFLAFAYHAGFLQSVDQAGLQIQGVMGTSSGALAGSLYAAGYTPHEVAHELCKLPPILRLRPSFRPWRGGIFSLHKVVERLQQLLPPTFADLPTKFACGVVTWEGRHLLIDKGNLAEAVAASIAVPFLFTAVDIPGLSGGPFKDGGAVDRVGLEAWRAKRRRELQPDMVPRACVHLVSRSSPFSGSDDVRGSCRLASNTKIEW